MHRKRYGKAHGPICHVTAGYCAGWYSALFGEFVLVREVDCAGVVGERCGFTARPAAQWLEAGDAWAQGLLKYLDFEAMRESALKRLAAAGDEIEGDMMGAFDPLSPAVHVWGPVMVLPYSGAGDSVAALGTNPSARRAGAAAPSGVVVLPTGPAPRIDAVGAHAGLAARTLDELARHNLEAVPRRRLDSRGRYRSDTRAPQSSVTPWLSADFNTSAIRCAPLRTASRLGDRAEAIRRNRGGIISRLARHVFVRADGRTERRGRPGPRRV